MLKNTVHHILFVLFASNLDRDLSIGEIVTLPKFAHRSGGKVLWWTRLCVCVCVCLSVCPQAYLRSDTRDIYQIFCTRCLWPWLGPPPTGWRNPKGNGQFWGFSSPLTMHCNAFAAEGIVQSPITSRSRRDHSVAAAFAAKGISLSVGKGVMAKCDLWWPCRLFVIRYCFIL